MTSKARVEGRSVEHTPDADREVKMATRAVWASGDYHRFATELLWDLGAALVDAATVRADHDVLDVACGSGNAALRAALIGAHVVACDLTPENFGPGRREATGLEVEVRWVEGDAEKLPFPTASFDVVLSSFGAMWAPDHQAVADELVRVCRPGGTIEPFLAVFDDFAPSPPAWAASPVLWGDETHVRRLFGQHVDQVTFTHGSYVERVPGGPEDYCRFYRDTFGPVVAIYRGLVGQPNRMRQLDRRFLEFATLADHGPAGEAVEITFEYVVVRAERRRSRTPSP